MSLMESINLTCPGCQAPVSQSMKECPYCGRPVVVTTFGDVMKLSGLDLRKYQNAFSNRNNGDPLNDISLGFVFLRSKLYEKAIAHFDKVIDSYFENGEVFMAAAAAQLKGKKPFLNVRSDINLAEKYLDIAIEIDNKAIYYYFLAYIRYDYHFRKGFGISPNYREYLQKAINMGVTQTDIHTLFELLNTEVPDVLKF